MLIEYYKKSKKPNQIRLELAPLIDIIFILLIFFAVSTSLVANKLGMKLKLPSAISTTEEKKGVILSINDAQEIFLDEKSILIEEIKDNISALINQNPEVQILLNADVATPYELVIHVLDEIRLGGCFDIVLEAEKKRANVYQ